MYGNRTFNNTNNISKNINQYTTGVVNNYKSSKVSNIKRRIIILIDDVDINKHNDIYTNDSINVTENKLGNSDDNNDSTKEI